MNHGTHKKHENGKGNLSGLAQKIKPFVEDIIRIQKQAKSLGIFVNDRENYWSAPAVTLWRTWHSTAH